MISPKYFFEELNKNGINFFTGVPDSLLKEFCSYISNNTVGNSHIIAANEGNALAIASGYYLSCGKPALVYMQNSGLGNVINPLLSLNDKNVYGIPALLLIGWRGEPNKKDEPQHIKQGEVTLDLLDAIGVKYYLLNEQSDDSMAEEVIKQAIEYMEEEKEPVAIIISKGTFQKYDGDGFSEGNIKLTRERAIEVLLNNINEDYIIVSTTGKTSRELFELREKHGESHERDFLVVGSMGHVSSIALGIALNKKDKSIYVFDGDGSFIMHMGSVAVNGQAKIENFRHIVFNNGSHESVGGQPTVGQVINITDIARACGYDVTYSVGNEEELEKAIKDIAGYKGKVLLEIKIKNGSRADLGRPTISLKKMKDDFMEQINR